MILQAAPHLRIARYRRSVLAAMHEVVVGDQYILGPCVRDFEAAFAEYCGVAHCVAVNSGTDALAIALKALGIGDGDEVITVAMTAPGTALAIRLCGAEPRFVDIDPATRCLDVRHAERAITARTAAIVPVHFHGYPLDVRPLLGLARAHDLVVVEDCAHAHGARRDGRCAGTFGNAGAFSFYPTKNLGCIGDGGAIVTGDGALADTMRSLRSFETQSQTDLVRTSGFNSRLDALQASILRVLLPHLDEGNGERARIARQYRRHLEGVAVDLPPDHPGAVYHQFAIAVDRRDEVRRYLKARNILTGTHYDVPLHWYPAFADCACGPLPATEAFARRVVSLPIQPEVAQGRELQVVEAVREALPVCVRKAA